MTAEAGGQREGGDGRRQGWWRVAWAIAVWSGAAALGVFIFGLVARLNQWDAWRYVSLLYAATALAAAGALGWARWRPEPRGRWMSVTAVVWVILAVAVVAAHLYLRSPAIRDAVAWIIRHLYLLRLH